MFTIPNISNMKQSSINIKRGKERKHANVSQIYLE